ncbi:hypothetical protein HYX58_05800 [Candidatus Dependentiae bacterium]|nr:hypothetical protein [Candidatus Dependentiae bacterium]
MLAYALLQRVLNLLWTFRKTDGRYIHLQQAFEGYKKTNIPLVQYSNGALYPFCAGDDIGIYWLMPKIALAFNCSIDTVMKLFSYGLPLIACLSGMLAFFLLFRLPIQRIVAAIGLIAVLLLSLRIGDVYVVYSSIIVALLPWIFYVCSQELEWYIYPFYGVGAGILIGFAHYFRCFAGLSSLIFIILFAALNKALSNRKKLSLIFALLIGMIIAHSYMIHQESVYERFARMHFEKGLLSSQTHYWHTIYVAFGLLKFGNTHDIKFEDKSAAVLVEKKRIENSDLISIPTEEILKNEVMRIFREQSFFVWFTIFAKLGILLLFFLLSANIGIISAWLYGKPWEVELCFASGILCSAIIPVISMPFLTYSLGFIAFCVIYGIMSINYALGSFDMKINFDHLPFFRLVRRPNRI